MVGHVVQLIAFSTFYGVLGVFLYRMRTRYFESFREAHPQLSALTVASTAILVRISNIDRSCQNFRLTW
jgi:hypothetical protein